MVLGCPYTSDKLCFLNSHFREINIGLDFIIYLYLFYSLSILPDPNLLCVANLFFSSIIGLLNFSVLCFVERDLFRFRQIHLLFHFITFGFYLFFQKFFLTPNSQRYSLCLLMNVLKFLFLHSDMQYETEIYFSIFPYGEPIGIPIYSVMISPMI